MPLHERHEAIGIEWRTSFSPLQIFSHSCRTSLLDQGKAYSALEVNLSAFPFYLIGYRGITVCADNVAYLYQTIPSSSILGHITAAGGSVWCSVRTTTVEIKLLLYHLLSYQMSTSTELNQLLVHLFCICLGKAAVVLLHPQVSRDDSCLAFQLSVCLCSFISTELKTWVKWEHCTFITGEETDTPLSKWPAVCALCKPSKGFKQHLSYLFVGVLHVLWQSGQGPPSGVQAQSSWGVATQQARQGN